MRRTWGSPPRVRGKVCSVVKSSCDFGITPACAGKRDRWCCGAWPLRDHPRVCGEKMVSMIPHRRSRGSPPRVRGKAKRHARLLLPAGITPAYAGKRPVHARTSSCNGDHPRVCGEKIHQLLPCRGARGSPPRMRGKGVRLFQRLGVGGITPACAGKSAVVRRNRRKPEDHPRVCGEKSMMVPHTLTLLGSPPRMRGKVTCTTMSTTTTGDHPRVCGEKFTSARGRSVA